MFPDPEVVREIAAEMGISPAFVEKDWYAVQVLKAVAAYQDDAFQAIFSGGTSLSKGYGLIQRFSEDLDFRCLAFRSEPGNQMRKLRRAYRQGMLEEIGQSRLLTLDREDVEVASNYVKFELGYRQDHEASPALRPGLQVEFSFTQPRLEPELRSVQSLVAHYTERPPELELPCLSPVETAADKVSALTWRVLKRNRASDNDDPTVIRHLHDLAALMSIVEENRTLFIETVFASFEEDQKTEKRDTRAGLADSVAKAMAILGDDMEYRGEYRRFVDAMSYAEDDENIDFDVAMADLERLHSWIRSAD